ncbi:MAG: hypothetical protein ACP5SH_02305 [Syntrophobacteraceae bacterium]
MPGIFGMVGKGRSEERSARLAVMLASMQHEPDYRSGTVVLESAGLWAGWTSHDNSFAADMPLWNEARDVCLVFTGENFADASDVERFGGISGNAGGLIDLYEEKGLHFIERLNGWFAGVLADFRRGLVVLFNDRYGLGRIYYHENRDSFYFSSEAKSLLRVMPELRELDLSSLAETFSCGCVLGNRTLFPKISLLPPGSRWVFEGAATPKKESYFHVSEWESRPVLGHEEYYGKLKETFAKILPRYCGGSRPVAMSLTGGLDGRMIMAWADRAPGNLPCYTFGGLYRDCCDVIIARKVAKICSQPHETICVGPSFFPEFPALAERSVFLSDGRMDVSGAVELYVNRIAAGLAPVRLTGNYGSEILRRHVTFKPASACGEMLDPDFADLVRKASQTYADERRGGKLSFIAFKQTPWHNGGRLSVEQSQLTMRSPFLDNELVALVYQAPAELAESPDIALRLIAEGDRRLGRLHTDRGLRYRPLPLFSELLHSYREFTYKAEYAYDYGMPQWMAAFDHALAPLKLERIFLGRQKFYHFRIWYRNELSRYVRKILLDPRSLARPYINGKRLAEIIDAHTKGVRNYTSAIHATLTTELIQRCLIENR